MGILDHILKRRDREPIILSSTRTRPLTGYAETLESQITKIDRLLKIDKVTEGIIRKYVIDVASGVISVDEDSKDAKHLQNSDLLAKVNRLLPYIVKDFFVYGNAYLEIIKNSKGRIIDIKYVNARHVTPEVDSTGLIQVDEYGEIKGYRWKPDKWYFINQMFKLRSDLDEESKGRFIPRDRIVHIRNLSLSGSLMGDSLVLRVEHISVIKGNIEYALGESADRHVNSLWIAKLGDNIRPPTGKDIEEMKERLSDAKLKGHDVLVFPYNVEFETETGGDLSAYVKPLELLLQVLLNISSKSGPDDR